MLHEYIRGGYGPPRFGGKVKGVLTAHKQEIQKIVEACMDNKETGLMRVEQHFRLRTSLISYDEFLLMVQRIDPNVDLNKICLDVSLTDIVNMDYKVYSQLVTKDSGILKDLRFIF